MTVSLNIREQAFARWNRLVAEKSGQVSERAQLKFQEALHAIPTSQRNRAMVAVGATLLKRDFLAVQRFSRAIHATPVSPKNQVMRAVCAALWERKLTSWMAGRRGALEPIAGATDPSRPPLLALVAESDDSGAYEEIQGTLASLSLHSQLNTRFLRHSWDLGFHLEQAVQANSKSPLSLIVMAHGNQDEMEFGDHPIFGRYLQRFVEKESFHWADVVVLDSCLVGSKGAIAEEIRKQGVKRVIAADSVIHDTFLWRNKKGELEAIQFRDGWEVVPPRTQKEAFEIIYEMRFGNDVEVWCVLAELYLYGKGERWDVSAIFGYCEGAARSGHRKAMRLLSDLHEERIGLSPIERTNQEAANLWDERAAEAGSPMAQFFLGEQYEFGRGGKPQDLAQAFFWYERSLRRGNKEARLRWAKKLEAEGADSKEVFALIHKAALGGSAEALVKIGEMHQRGLGTEKSFPKAVSAYVKAAVLGGEIGIGLRLKQRYGRAKAEAEYRLGQICAQGKGAHVALAHAFEQSRMRNVAHLIAEYDERPLAESLGKAISFYEKAAVNWDHSGAFYELGLAYERDGDSKKAFEAFETAARRKLPIAQDKLGQIYRNEGENYKAREWFEKGADQGYAPAQYHLGEMVEKLREPLEWALKWYKKAMDQGHEEARSSYERILPLVEAERAEALERDRERLARPPAPRPQLPLFYGRRPRYDRL